MLIISILFESIHRQLYYCMHGNGMLVCYCCRNSMNILTISQSTMTSRKSAGQSRLLQDCRTHWNIIVVILY